MAHVEFFDSHCHVDPMRYGGDIEDVLARARAAGVSRMTVVGTRAADSEAAVRLSEKEEGVFCAAGIHPNDADDVDEEEWSRVRSLIDSENLSVTAKRNFCQADEKFQNYLLPFINVSEVLRI